jgi:hypothetical protein
MEMVLAGFNLFSQRVGTLELPHDERSTTELNRTPKTTVITSCPLTIKLLYHEEQLIRWYTW